MRKLNLTTIVAAATLFVMLLAYMLTFQVRFNETAVRIRLGRAVATKIDAPGLYFRLPLGIESVRKFDTRLHVLDTSETEIKTLDGQNLIVGSYAIWRIADPLLYSQRLPNDSVESTREAEEKLRTRLSEARSRVIGQHALSDLFNLDAELVARTREKINEEMRAAVADEIRNAFGIEVLSVSIRRNTVPDSATGAILAAMSAERMQLASRFTAEGKSRAEAIKSQASAAKDKILAFASRQAEKIRSEGARASASILAKIDPGDSDFFIWLRYLEALEVSLRERSTIFIDWNSDLYRYFNSPAVKARAPKVGQSPVSPSKDD